MQIDLGLTKDAAVLISTAANGLDDIILFVGVHQ